MNDAPSRLAAFIAELRHRRVFRVAAVYACVAFIIIQIIDGAFDYLRIPEWVGTTIIVLLALGFFIAVGMAWAFDLTEKGLVRAKPKREPTAAKAPHHPLVGNKSLAVIAVLAIVFGIWSWLRLPSPGGAPIRSIAVLPLEDLMGDPEQEYFVEGMHEALISALSNIGAVTVISRRSTLQYKDSEKTMPAIASELGVDALLEGSAQLVGERVRITTQLIDSKDRHLWNNTYERKIEDVFALYNDVTLAIAQEIRAKLTPQEEIRLASAPQVNPEAYDLYLRGWHIRGREGRENTLKAAEYLEQAVALDPTFARAWSALGHSYLLSGGFSIDAVNRMKEAFDKALELDPNLPDAIAGLGMYQFFKWDNGAAEEYFRRALELDPDNAYALYEYGNFLNRTGRPDEALAMFRRGQELDPLDPLPFQGIWKFYGFTRQYEKQLEIRLLEQELLGESRENSTIKLNILMQQGRYAEVAEQVGVNTWEGMRARMAMGNTEEVYAYRDSLSSWDPYTAAAFYAIMGEKEKALSLLEAFVDTPKPLFMTPGLVYTNLYLMYFPEFDSLRAESRFKTLLQKLGLPEVFDQNGQRIR
ncbi:MAG: tetratricopeptide repeat protein [Calditrichaeota bacterium]|nr:tetratricopeptide repeat protein [Calditrichota bacterium]